MRDKPVILETPSEDLRGAQLARRDRPKDRYGSKLEQLTLSQSGPLYPSKPDIDVAREHFAVGPILSKKDFECVFEQY